MQAGLYGVSELQPAGGLPDYQARSISPVASRVASRAGLLRGTKAASVADLGPGPTRTLVESLSNPELRHILKRWQIRHPSGVPLGHVERSDLIELAVQFEVCLTDRAPPRRTHTRAAAAVADRAAAARLPGAPVRHRAGAKGTGAQQGE